MSEFIGDFHKEVLRDRGIRFLPRFGGFNKCELTFSVIWPFGSQPLESPHLSSRPPRAPQRRIAMFSSGKCAGVSGSVGKVGDDDGDDAVEAKGELFLEEAADTARESPARKPP